MAAAAAPPFLRSCARSLVGSRGICLSFGDGRRRRSQTPESPGAAKYRETDDVTTRSLSSSSPSVVRKLGLTLCLLGMGRVQRVQTIADGRGRTPHFWSPRVSSRFTHLCHDEEARGPIGRRLASRYGRNYSVQCNFFMDF